MNVNEKKYLPIGTVVKLKGSTKKIMITGFYSKERTIPEKIWDYNGCLYPEGIISSEQIRVFDHSQIQEVCYEGFSDDEEENEFKNKLNQIINAQNQESGTNAESK